MNAKEKELEQVKEYLLESLSPGDTVYTILKHVSQSGMYRVVDAYVIKDNQPLRLSWNASKVTGKYDRRHEGIGVGGCGMDVGFEVVYNLSYFLFNDGYALNHRWLG